MNFKVNFKTFESDMLSHLDIFRSAELDLNSIFNKLAANDGGKDKNLIEVDSKEIYEKMLVELLKSCKKDKQISKSQNNASEELKENATRVLQGKYEINSEYYEKFLKALNEGDSEAISHFRKFGLE